MSRGTKKIIQSNLMFRGTASHRFKIHGAEQRYMDVAVHLPGWLSTMLEDLEQVQAVSPN